MSFLKSISSLNILHESPRFLDEKYKVYKGFYLYNIYVTYTYIFLVYIHRDIIEREENKNKINFIIVFINV